MTKLHGNIFSAALLVLFLGACGPEEAAETQEPTTVEDEDPITVEDEELKVVELPKAGSAGSGETLSYGYKAGESSAAMTSFLELVLNDVHSFWADLMIQGGNSQPVVDYVLPYEGDTEETGCTSSGSTGPEDAYYCVEEDLIVFANELAMSIWESEASSAEDPETGAAAGNFAVAAAMADIYSHSFQEEWGWLPGATDQERLVPVENTEMNAACLTGIWAQSVYGEDMLEAGAVESAMETLTDAGQHDLAEEPALGTPAERTDAFMTGFESGTADSCNSYLSADAS